MSTSMILQLQLEHLHAVRSARSLFIIQKIIIFESKTFRARGLGETCPQRSDAREALGDRPCIGAYWQGGQARINQVSHVRRELEKKSVTQAAFRTALQFVATVHLRLGLCVRSTSAYIRVRLVRQRSRGLSSLLPFFQLIRQGRATGPVLNHIPSPMAILCDRI